MSSGRIARPAALGLLLAAAAGASHDALASVGYRPRSTVDAELALHSLPELGGTFKVVGRVRFLTSVRGCELTLDVPAGLERVAGGSLHPVSVTTGTEVEVWAELRAAQPVNGAEVRLNIRFRDRGAFASERQLVTRSLFLTVTEREGGQGMAGEMWDHYLIPGPPAFPVGYVVKDYGPLPDTPARGPVEQALRLYGTALHELAGAHPGAAAAGFAAAGQIGQTDVAWAARNAMAVSRALSGDRDGARKEWEQMLAIKDLPARIRGYLHYNWGIMRVAHGDHALARDQFRQALASNPGFSLARSILSGDTHWR